MTISESELEVLLKKATKEGIREYQKELSRGKRKDKYHDTFRLMKCYQDAVFHIENAVSEETQLELESKTDEAGEIYLRSIRRTRFRTMLMTAHIDKAIDEMERRRIKEDRALEYKAFELYFIHRLTYLQIAEELHIGKNTPRNWITGIIKELSILLWGLDGSWE